MTTFGKSIILGLVYLGRLSCVETVYCIPEADVEYGVQLKGIPGVH